MIKMIVTICAIENVPIENSHFHRLLTEDHGPEVAAYFTYDIELPRDDVCETLTPLSTLSSAS